MASWLCEKNGAWCSFTLDKDDLEKDIFRQEVEFMGINRPVDDDIDFYFNNYKKNHDICRFKFTVERSDSTQLQLRLSCGGTGSYGRHIWIDRARIATHFIHGNGRTTASEWQFEVSAISSRLLGAAVAERLELAARVCALCMRLDCHEFESRPGIWKRWE